MKIFFLDCEPFFYCVPRKYPKVTDSIKLVLRDEQNSDEYLLDTEFIAAEKLRIKAIDVPDTFKAQQTFDLTLLISDEVIYKGRLIILDKDTDVQNFTYGTQNNAKYDFR